jgi:lysyl-tRNA synthetase class 2
MSWQPTTTHKTRQLRAQLLHDIRAFFLQKKVLEVETPALSQAGNTDPFIASLQIEQGTPTRYLHTSPEYPMKRLLADGSGDIYQICKVWRAGESGRNHNPEFTMLEWYRVGFHYHQLIQEVSELLLSLLPTVAQQTQIVTYQQLFLDRFNINPHQTSQQELAACVQKNISNLTTDNLNQQALLDALLTHCIEPGFNKNALTFIIDYPIKQSALAQIRTNGNTSVAERFEVYLGTTELGNGYQEEINHKRNVEILVTENAQRKTNKQVLITQDQRFLDAMKAGMPVTSGVAIGLDRILMILAKVDSIQEVINFPWDNA